MAERDVQKDVVAEQRQSAGARLEAVEPLESVAKDSRGEVSAFRMTKHDDECPPTEPERSMPTMLAEFRIVRKLGGGGMGDVYVGHDTLLDRPVAIKVIRDLQSDEQMRQQLVGEARAAARIQHPNVVTIHRVGEVNGLPFIVSELVRGKPLAELELPLSPDRALEIGIELSRGLAAAHRRGVLHRDIKPGNAILTEDGHVKLLDFGLAKLFDASQQRAKNDGQKPRQAFSSADLALPAPVSIATIAPPELDRTMPVVPSPPSGRSESDSISSDDDDGGPIIGTPHYMAPEIWMVQPATRKSDVYALGVLLFELCTGRTPHADTAFSQLPMRVVTVAPPPLASLVPSMDPAFAAIVDRCLKIDPQARFASGEELREALEQVQKKHHAQAVPEGNPYRGLLAFEAEHRALFFGRDPEIGTILERLRSDSFVLVAGDSGSGKSSLCRAGVLPRIGEGALDPARQYATAVCIPGRRPLASISRALAAALGGLDERELVDIISVDPIGLRAFLLDWAGTNRGIVLFVDQLEELVTVSDPAEAKIVSEALAELSARSPSVRLLMTVRGDFLSRAAALPALGDELARALYLLRPLSPEKLREAIVGPAHAKNVSFESEALVDELVASTARAQGGMPLLQFALAELWEARSADRITASSLARIGGVEGALARHADHVLDSLPQASQAAARRALKALVTTQRTRARRTEDELVNDDPEARVALDAFVRGRILVAREAEGGTAYELAHEALVHGWSTLRKLLDEEEDERIARERLAAAAAEWERLGRIRDALWGAAQIGEIDELEIAGLGARDAAFLKASRRTVALRRFVTRAALLFVPVFALTVYGAVQLQTRQKLAERVAAHEREAAAHLSTLERIETELDDLRARSFAAFDGMRKDEGEKLWDDAKARSAEADSHSRAASAELEAAIALDGDRVDMHERLASLLYRRAIAAERDHQSALRDELVQRMKVHDVTGEWVAKLDAMASIDVETDPPSASVVVERYTLPSDGRAMLGERRELGDSPVRGLELPAGSYLFTLSAPGRVDVRYPVFLQRSQRYGARVVLPWLEQIPNGFVYVPPGRFFFGSAEDGIIRKSFFVTVPMHALELGAFLIARHETTFGEWIEFLRSRTAERDLPRGLDTATGDFTGGVRLSADADGVWTLSLKPTTKVFTVRTGEPFTYPGRKTQRVQDWYRMPVTGMSFKEASDYVEWLASSGRVPGAHLCSDFEWERAARGGDTRIYPSGNDFKPDEANIGAKYGIDPSCAGPDEVGTNPASGSPFGVDDMAGNVFEWTVSSLAKDEVVMRSGSYFYDQMTARSSNRTVVEKTFKDPRFGLRVCATLQSP